MASIDVTDTADANNMRDGIPRLQASALDPGLRQYLCPTVDRLGYLGEFFQALGHAPAAVIQFMEFTRTLRSSLNERENEVIALAVCALLGIEYERIQHERLAHRLGLSHEWIAAAEGLPGTPPGVLNREESALRQLAVAIASRGGARCSEEIRAVAKALGPAKAVAALLQVARYIMITHLCNALDLQLPVRSIFDTAN
ncbi:carboxymuconolactone decarboxylase family protein [Cupriavidus sp. CV2]|uniref:carboxymuconolactone decarboxylase family protein n=1 Tax=Cupriavidus ulmosensis TaxID=3065913 RepID=UPI00296B006F|nr:carboxymuconolactone decarboxylase family protein [Cupriavidus sp. CV2]MDW3685998.1 carboxymuconolactone decarboxylase family protein [Cupriavidus sp. CV2]